MGPAALGAEDVLEGVLLQGVSVFFPKTLSTGSAWDQGSYRSSEQRQGKVSSPIHAAAPSPAPFLKGALSNQQAERSYSPLPAPGMGSAGVCHEGCSAAVAVISLLQEVTTFWLKNVDGANSTKKKKSP